MADEKKPKIDLKARLGKTNVGVAPPPGGPVPPPVAQHNAGIPAPPMSNRPPAPNAIPVPQGMGQMPAGIDPNNPIMAAMAPKRSHPVPPPQPQRIEVDETVVEEARGKSRRQGIVMGLAAGVVFAILGYVGGTANEARAARAKSVQFAVDLTKDITAAKAQLEKIAAKIDEGRADIGKKKFPEKLASDLRSMNVDFDGLKLEGARFSGFSRETTQNLMQFITQVQSVNDRRQAVANLVEGLQKPLQDQWTGKPQTVHVAVVTKTGKGPFAQLAQLKEPLTGDAPNEFVMAKGPKLNRFMNELKEPALGVPLFPGAFEQMCPSETLGQMGQLGAQLGKLTAEINGDKADPSNPINDGKPGLLKKADLLMEGLRKVR